MKPPFSSITIPGLLLLVNLQNVSAQPAGFDRNAYNGMPNYSPSGNKMAFVSGRDGNREIYVMNADGSGQTRLTNHDSTDSASSWSPDGKKIIFESIRENRKSVDIYEINPDGTGLKRLTNLQKL